METPIEPPCQTKQEGKEHKEGKGGAVLVERGYIADLDGLGAGCLHLDGVGVLHNAIPPTSMPAFLKHRVRTDVDEDAVMEIDTIALDMGGKMIGGGVGNGLHRVTGTKHKHGQEHCAQTDSAPCR